MVAALSAAARLGILIKNVGDIELAARINAFIFDKTGTFTTGKLAVSRLAPRRRNRSGGITVYLRICGKIQQSSDRQGACRTWRKDAGVTLAEPKNFAETAGRGIKAAVDGQAILVGRAQWLKDNGIKEDFTSRSI